MRKRRLSGRTWHFSDVGNKFDGRPKPQRRNMLEPISPALKRGVIHCTRCGSRVVSNVDHCPFCGRSLRPVFARLWFWLIVVVLVAVSIVWFITANLPEENTTPSSPVDPALPQVIGAEEGSSFKNLELDTAIDNSGLHVSVESVSVGPQAADGSQIYSLSAEFSNTTEETIILYSTQWLLELSNGTRVDTFVGAADDGTTVTSNFEAYELEAGKTFSGRLYFAVAKPQRGESTNAEGESDTEELLQPRAVVYHPSALTYSEDLLVTWRTALFTPNTPPVD